MTILGRFIRRLVEVVLGRWHEGPETPVRYFEEVRMFRVLNPNATPELWEQFCHDMIDRSYRDAYVRGFQNSERWWPGPPTEAERLAEAAQHDWSLAREDAHWAAAMARVGEPRTAREVVETRQKGLQLQHAYRHNRLR